MNNIIKSFIASCIEKKTVDVERFLGIFEEKIKIDREDKIILDHVVGSLGSDAYSSIFAILVHVAKNPKSVLMTPILKCLQKFKYVERIYREADYAINVVPVIEKAIELDMLSSEYFSVLPMFFNRLSYPAQIKTIHKITKFEKLREEFGMSAKKYRPAISNKIVKSINLAGLKQYVITFRIDKEILEQEAVKILKDKEKYKYIASYSKFYDQIAKGSIRTLTNAEATVDVKGELINIEF